LVGALTAYESRKSAWYHRPRIAIPLAAAAAALLLGSTFLGLRQARIRWARNTMAPRIAALVAAHSYSAADEVVQQIENIVPGDAAVRDFQRTYRIVTTTVTTTPSGATVEIQDYGTPSAPWRTLGQSPLKNRTLPIGYFRWRVSAAGYRTREFAESGVMQRAISFHLYKDLDAPAGMVLVPAGVTNGTNPVQVPDFWLDQFEVTNRQYQAFVDAGGYRRPEFWQEPVAGSGRAIPFEEEMRLFLDQTGRSGPATWEVGTYSEGKSEFPVTGVSWYEAAAYARFAGKSLPAYFQWLRASGTEWLYADAILMSNFSGKGLARVGSYQALDRFGSYDLAGNAKEWIWNEEGPGRRMAMGGAWDDAYYAAREGDRLYPLERRADIGFRCVKNLSPLPASFQAPAQVLASLGASRNLVADAEFAEIAERYNYQRTPLNARLLESDDSNRYWRKLKISFSAGYEDERVVAYLFLPRASTPPYQTVIYSPSNIAWNARDSRHLEMWYLEPLIRSGRAVLYPVLWGTYERHYTGTLKGLDLMRMRRVRQTQDVRRSLDYLESRQDMEGGKLAYFGFSAGAFVAPIVLATEPRFKAAILAVGGLQGETAADVDPFQFAPRAHVPVLMMNGRYDLNYPLATSQRPLFDLLGVPVRDKKMILLEAGHAMIGFPETTRASLDWLDHYLGPVRSR
jgi:dienelactone hydrolase